MSDYQAHRRYPPRRARRHPDDGQAGYDITEHRLAAEGISHRDTGQFPAYRGSAQWQQGPVSAQDNNLPPVHDSSSYSQPQVSSAQLGYDSAQWGYQRSDMQIPGTEGVADGGPEADSYAVGGPGYDDKPAVSTGAYPTAAPQPYTPEQPLEYAASQTSDITPEESPRYQPSVGPNHTHRRLRRYADAGQPGVGHHPEHRAATTQVGGPTYGGVTPAQEFPVSAASYPQAPQRGEHGGDAILARASAGSPSSRPRRRKRGKKIAVVTVVVVALIVVAVAAVQALGGFSTLFGSGADYKGRGTGHVSVTIPKGATGKDIARLLEQKDVVASAAAFESAFKSNSLSQGVQPGTYKLRHKMSAVQALALLLDPAARSDLTVTIPDGFTLAQIKKRLHNVAGFSVDSIDAACKDTAALGLPAVAKGNLEGWLAADSYSIDTKQNPRVVLKKMVALQNKRLDQAGVPLQMREEVLTKASILEREVNIKKYYPQVARVIENRLHDNPDTHGLLQMDSTVLFGLGKSGGIPSKDDLKQDTPYNTYLHKGLPPGPIGVPGLSAMQAVMHPQEGNWLYFTTVNLQTGETKFATTLDEHKQNMAQLRDYCKANPDDC